MGLTSDVAIDRLACTLRPAGRAIGRQSWRNLLFVHWRVPCEQLAPLLPRRLTVDRFEGSAWIGLVPFTMHGVRPWWSPAVRGVSSFHETNVRTYVHCQGDPGVWFFSLDAANTLAVRLARWRWRLPYFRAQMRVERTASRVSYESRRLWPGPPGAATSIEAEIGGPLPSTDDAYPPGRALPGTLEHFLAERYLLYSQATDGNELFRGRVHHVPYPLRTARLLNLQESLLAAAGIPAVAEPEHVMFSDGVDVEVFPLRRVLTETSR
jgi:uncharacterized protein YqjF (DUF2071 family)